MPERNVSYILYSDYMCCVLLAFCAVHCSPLFTNIIAGIQWWIQNDLILKGGGGSL